MAIDVALRHRTSYRYDRPVQLGPQIIRLRPAPHCRTRVLSYSLTVTPKLHFINWQQDPQGNYLARFVFPERTREFSVDVDLVAEMAVFNPFDFFLEPEAEKIPFSYAPWLAKELAPYLTPLPAGPLLREWLASVPREETLTADFLVALNQRLQGDIGYVIRMEPGIQTCEQTLGFRRGSCRDTGWLLVQILRNLGLAARFVSGYLIQLKPDEKPLEGPAGAAEDFTDLHAWTEVYLPGAGWIGLDPTSGLFAGEGHLPLVCTPDPESAAPITGSVDAAETAFDFSMTIERIRETPRVTKPYADDQWKGILAVGEEVDRRLKAADVRLTVGGEPTFVSIDDMDGAEWNTDADGPAKRHLATELVGRLRDRFAPGGLIHFGQGKWYPGESLPRWAYALFWRRDGKELWNDPALIASDANPSLATVENAEQFAIALAESLNINPEYAVPAYEDPFPYVAREQSLPDNVDPFDSKLEDPEERARLARVFERGLGNPVGYVLPVQRWNARDGRARWASERWRFRRGRLFLVPGDSPLGFRLPLGSLPWITPEWYPYYSPGDPFEQRPPLPEPRRLRQQRRVPPASPAGGSAGGFGTGGSQGRGERQTIVEQELPIDINAVRTAVGIEARDGTICVFMPPLETADDYVEMIAAIETAAAAVDLPVRIEGYTPPTDPRMGVIKVTPDPGVIEVNIHPSRSWSELVATTTGLYEDARNTRLGTEKFMLDGRHTGTGGGNHIVVGGASPADSPFLRRPDLLRSLITYWQNHPALSYLFSGLFIGPTSQAPRVDEARNDQLYELELAFRQIPDPGTMPVPPWLVDRILRNLLIDSTGNTHRAEVCIDKLYNPDGPSGRLGLVEFRAFEMPPHARMSLAQHLLLRALISWFWNEPYTQPLVRWGTTLHDRFMLPHYVWKDLLGVVGDLNRAEIPIEAEWYAPHFEFRFPLYGAVDHGGVKIELRQALEPWHVMGEEGAIGGTVRYVDSSLERLQVRTTGLTANRFVLICNGQRVPLQSTGTFGEYVAGVRYRAWQPPACLHPTLPPDAPLVFDLFDTWSNRSLGGCTYNVAHPGGRNYETFPVNAYEAESRRCARFVPFGHTPGHFRPPAQLDNEQFPSTLDLRWSRLNG
ncbi:MAG: transglutaminase family protein [Rhodospirillales bacterium]|nr:transglutaminase family protein [Rhodospirillales bacterium]